MELAIVCLTSFMFGFITTSLVIDHYKPSEETLLRYAFYFFLIICLILLLSGLFAITV